VLTGFNWLRIESSGENSNEPSGSIKGKFPDVSYTVLSKCLDCDALYTPSCKI
jgi:hypothetical protein